MGRRLEQARRHADTTDLAGQRIGAVINIQIQRGMTLYSVGRRRKKKPAT